MSVLFVVLAWTCWSLAFFVGSPSGRLVSVLEFLFCGWAVGYHTWDSIGGFPSLLVGVVGLVGQC